MKKYLLAVLLLASFQSFGQFLNYTNINGRYKWIAGKFDSTFTIPSGTTPSLRVGGGTGPGALFYRTTDSTVYQYTGTQWIKLRAGVSPTDTAGIWISNVYRQTGTDSVFYVKGGTSTFAFRDSIGNVGGGGGGGKIYYFNGGVNLGTFAGLTMYELGDTAVTSAAANFTRSTTGNLANFITDVNRPGLLQIPAGVWTVDAYLSETGGGANHAEIWIEVEKWNGSTITTIATSPIEQITNGNVIDLYTWGVSIPTTTLAVTDRIIIQFYITNTNGKTVTLYTQNGYVGEVHTTFTTGIGSLNGLTAPTQYFATGTSGTDFAISSSTATHTFNLPTASGSNRGALSSADWTTFNGKVGGSGTTNYVPKFTASGTIGNSQIFDNGTNVGIGLTSPANALHIDKGTGVASYSQFTAGVLTGQLATDGFEVGIDASANAVINQQENLPMLFYTNNTERMRILQGGNVGIGTISPAAILDVNASNGEIRSTGTSTNYTQYNAFITSGVNMRIGAYATSNGYLGTTTNHPFTIETNNTQRARVFANGNWLIGSGTTDGGYLLDVNGSLRSTSSQFDNGAQVGKADNTSTYPTLGLRYASGSGADIQGYQGGSVSVKIRMQATNLYINTPGSMIFCNAVNETNESMRIVTSTKNVLIGTTTDAGYKLDVNGTARVRESLFMLRSDAAATVEALKYGTANTVDIGTTFRVIGTNQWNNTTSSTSYIQNGYSTKTFVTTNAANGNFSSYDFSASNAYQPTIANPYTQKLINGAMTIQSTAATNSFHGISISTTDNSYSIANNVFAVYADATLGTNTSATRWAGYFVGRGYFSQVLAIGTTSPNASALLDVSSTTRGFLPPRMTNAQMVAIATPAAGLVVYDTTNNKLNVYDGTNWVAVH